MVTWLFQVCSQWDFLRIRFECYFPEIPFGPKTFIRPYIFHKTKWCIFCESYFQNGKNNFCFGCKKHHVQFQCVIINCKTKTRWSVWNGFAKEQGGNIEKAKINGVATINTQNVGDCGTDHWKRDSEVKGLILDFLLAKKTIFVLQFQKMSARKIMLVASRQEMLDKWLQVL